MLLEPVPGTRGGAGRRRQRRRPAAHQGGGGVRRRSGHSFSGQGAESSCATVASMRRTPEASLSRGRPSVLAASLIALAINQAAPTMEAPDMAAVVSRTPQELLPSDIVLRLMGANVGEHKQQQKKKKNHDTRG